jgi:uroporphyrinogen decarboxylase
MAIVDDLIEIGVTVLNPVQPECMDVVEVKRRWGDKLAFWGTIGTQSVMPFGTPEDVKREVKRMIELFATGLVIAPTHVLEPDVPWENIVAFFEAVEEFGQY